MGIGFADYGLERFQITPLIIHSSDILAGMPGWSSSGAFSIGANRAQFIPFTLSEMVVIKRMSIVNGASVSGNVDVGIYDQAGNRLVSIGGVAQGPINSAQIFDIADTQLAAGRYYLAVVLSGTAGLCGLSGFTGGCVYAGVKEMAAAYPLPDTATFADNLIRSFIPHLAAMLTAA